MCLLHWIQSFWSRGQSPEAGEYLSIKYEIRISPNAYSSEALSPPWSFCPTSELRIISRRHVNRRQVLSTVDRRRSITLSDQLCAQHDDDWVWRNASRGPLVSTTTCGYYKPAGVLPFCPFNCRVVRWIPLVRHADFHTILTRPTSR